MRRLTEWTEWILRNVIVYPILRLLFRNKQRELPIDLAQLKSVLILRYDKIGDMVVTLPVFRILKNRNPHIHIGVVTSVSNAEILRAESSVDSCFILYRNPLKLLSELYRIRRDHYDVVLNFIFNRTTSGALIANLACPNAVKIGQGADKYRFYFNVLLSLPRADKHMLDILIYYVEQVFGLTIMDEERQLLMMSEPIADEKVGAFLLESGLRRRSQPGRLGPSYMILNISAREANKRISSSQAHTIARHLAQKGKVQLLIVAAPEDSEMRAEIVAKVNSSRCLSYPAKGNSSLSEIVSLVKGAVCVISPDTAIIHVASGTRTPVLGMFTPLLVNQEWLPYKVKHALVVAPEGEPVSAISGELLVREIDQFLNSIAVPGFSRQNDEQSS
jgi:ADP-heptose:LPS heptosyltransferase